MIVAMLKYTVLVFYKEYTSFLHNLQEIGVVHIARKEGDVTDEMKHKYQMLNKYEKAILFLKKRTHEKTESKTNVLGKEILEDIIEKQKDLEILNANLEETNGLIQKAKPWGSFSHELINTLEKENIHLSFFKCTKKKFNEFEKQNLPIQIISEHDGLVIFMLIKIRLEDIPIDADPLQLPDKPYHILQNEKIQTEVKIEQINSLLNSYAETSIPVLENCKNDILQALQIDNVLNNTSKKADQKLMVLEGWVPKTKETQLKQFLEETETLYYSRKAKPDDQIPVLLKNNRFSRLFEPIGSMFSLPNYAELDLTIFFAPFFMLFFGFCLGDAGYGLLFIVGGGVYKLKAKKSVKPYLSLIQYLGLATILFGSISGTFFGINLIETEISLTSEFRHMFLNPDKMFNLALILGAIQIIFGMFIKAANQTRQYGFMYSLATYGWLIILLGSVTYSFLSGAEIISKNKNILYAILIFGGFFVLFFSDPGKNVFARIGKGVWDIYSTVTGIFGDLLSYIRLFALGLSSAILGFVINDIGLQILGASKVLGPIFFVIFLLLGHTLNILISSLGSFVHPMRLTFVEFYKSAGFKGGGEEYKPFSKNYE